MSIILRENALRNIFDAVHDGILISNPVTGEFIEANGPGCQMFGFTKAELVGSDFGLLSSGVRPYTLAGAIENAKKAMVGPTQLIEWHCKTKGGRLFWAEISISHIEIGQIPAIVSIVRDITDRKRMVDELNAALYAASNANKAKSAFLANMSHELRTPLNAIIGFSDLVLSEVMGPLGNPRYHEYIGDIHGSGFQLLRLIDDLLDLSAIDAGKVTLAERNVSLPDVIAEACRMVRPQAIRFGVGLTIDIAAGLPQLFGDERRIMQIVLNLLSNAIKFTPQGGTVCVRAEMSANGLLVKISDTGIGIAAEDLPKALERFGQVESTLSDKHKGTGLGLPLVKELMELHGGTISIDSKVAVGTVVSVRFPNERVIAAANDVAA